MTTATRQAGSPAAVTHRPALGRAISLACPTALATARMHLAGFDVGICLVEGMAPVLVRGGDVRLGRRLSLRGRQAPVELGALPGGRLEIGDGVFINSGATVVASHSVVVEDDVRIGDFVAVLDSDHHAIDQITPTRVAPVTLERNVWLGRAAVVLPGVTVGAHAVVAAGSVVTHDVPPRTLVGGTPARPIRSLTADDDWRRP